MITISKEELDALIKEAAALLVLDSAHQTVEWYRSIWQPYSPTFEGRAGKMIEEMYNDKIRYQERIEVVFNALTDDWIKMRTETRDEYYKKNPHERS